MLKKSEQVGHLMTLKYTFFFLNYLKKLFTCVLVFVISSGIIWRNIEWYIFNSPQNNVPVLYFRTFSFADKNHHRRTRSVSLIGRKWDYYITLALHYIYHRYYTYIYIGEKNKKKPIHWHKCLFIWGTSQVMQSQRNRRKYKDPSREAVSKHKSYLFWKQIIKLLINNAVPVQLLLFSIWKHWN